MQCFVCLEDISEPWDEEGQLDTLIKPCCGRACHHDCILQANAYSGDCGWCRAKKPTDYRGIQLQLKKNVMDGRAWAMLEMAQMCMHGIIGQNLWLANTLLRRAIPKLTGSAWNEKLATSARCFLVDVILMEQKDDWKEQAKEIIDSIDQHPFKAQMLEYVK